MLHLLREHFMKNSVFTTEMSCRPNRAQITHALAVACERDSFRPRLTRTNPPLPPPLGDPTPTGGPPINSWSRDSVRADQLACVKNSETQKWDFQKISEKNFRSMFPVCF